MNKGFTLVELLGVITILLIILVLAIPAVTRLISSSEDTIYDAQIDRILTATYDYSLKNTSILPDKYQKSYITLSELIYSGYVDPLKNPKDDKLFPDDYLISIENVGSGYKNTEKYTKKSGDYLYKVEYELMNDAWYISNKPSINLSGYSSLSAPTALVQQNGTFTLPEVSVTYNNGETDVDITSIVKLTRNILLNDELVDSVDTSKVGIYKVNYVAIYVEDENAIASSLTLNVVVNDTEAPTIILPSNNTISISVNSYNVLEGVRCIDNSGECDINFSGNISYGHAGSYVITYTAKDPSGNTTVSRRTITVQ